MLNMQMLYFRAGTLAFLCSLKSEVTDTLLLTSPCHCLAATALAFSVEISSGGGRWNYLLSSQQTLQMGALQQITMCFSWGLCFGEMRAISLLTRPTAVSWNSKEFNLYH